MNKKELLLKRTETWKKFHTPGCQNFCKRKRNAVFISPANSLEHEIAKLKVCYDLRKAKKEFITEAVENATGFRRDVVCLDNEAIWEIELDRKRAMRFKDQDGDIRIVKLWEEKK